MISAMALKTMILCNKNKSLLRQALFQSSFMNQNTAKIPEPFTDHTPMPFGKYVGKAMVNVPAVYLLWLHNKGCDHQGVKNYINDNLDALQKEAGATKRY